MGGEMGLVAFVLAGGFVAAGLLNSLHLVLLEQMREAVGQSEHDEGLVLYFDRPISIAWSVVMCTFAGPWLVLSQGIRFWRREILPTSALFLCGIISTLWSFCSGVVILETAFAISGLG